MTRARPRGATSYTARLYQRPAARRHWPTWLTSRTPPAVLMLCAELIHLAAAVAEWPAAPARGLSHVLVAAALGVVTAVVYSGQNRWELVAGTVLTLAVPITWIVRTPLYQDFPVVAAIAVTVLEILAAGLLSAAVASGARPPRRRRA